MEENTKNFVLDTNVLLHDGNALQSFGEHNVIIPLAVVEELDGIKKRQGEIGVHARDTLRGLEACRGESTDLITGVPRNDKGGLLRVVPLDLDEETSLINEHNLKESVKDNLIILTAMKVKRANPDVETILVSNDLAVRIKASTVGLYSAEFRDSKIKVEPTYTGYNKEIIYDDTIDGDNVELKTNIDNLLQLNACESIALSSMPDDMPLAENEFIHVIEKTHNEAGKEKKRTVIGKKRGVCIVKMKSGIKVYGDIGSKNKEQALALDLLMDDSVKVLTLSGIAGTGKTLLATATALTKVITEKKYDKILLLKPTVSVGENEIGFLPGDKYQKIQPFLASYTDNLSYIKRRETLGSKTTQDTFEQMIEDGIIEIESLAYLRGRSLLNQIIIIDESQNMSQSETKTLISRVGENSKIIMLGDVTQIDSHLLNMQNNGLTRVINNFRGLPFYGHVELVHSERSEISEAAAKLL